VETYQILEAITMCGIFGFVLKKRVSMVKVFRVLQKLEAHKYPIEPRPVGGFGAGVAIIKEDGGVLLEKVGKTVTFHLQHSCLKKLKLMMHPF
jgi:hypothetical protein